MAPSIYLDHAATTPVAPEVLDAMIPYYREFWGNPSSIHRFGRQASQGVEEARASVAKLLNCTPKEIYFTSGGTEADNLAIFGTAMAKEDKGKHIITSAIEHHAVLHSCEALEKRGWEVTYLPVDNTGRVDPEAVRAAIRPDTVLVTIMHANNEIGTVQPIAEIGKICREAKVWFHTDAVQSVGHIPTRVDELNVDMLSLSGHKLYGPKGIGVLYIRRGVRVKPLIYGGGHERGMRSGTENVPAMVGLGRAAELAMAEMEAESVRQARLRDKLLDGLTSRIPDCIVTGNREHRLPNNASIISKYVEGEAQLLRLDAVGIAASSGSACTSGSLDPSHVLLSIGTPVEFAHGSLRFSLGRGTTEEEIDYVLEQLPPIIETLRAMSPFGPSSAYVCDGGTPAH
ncbi:MAG TPA: cysteine desulfurase NifS [Armatimonadota bacterium]|nr:cysteine desulfurase NifS [Armatimonadota bacterium]